MTLPSSARPATDCLRKSFCSLWLRRSGRAMLRRPVRTPPALSPRDARKEVHGGEVVTFQKPDFQFPHESGHRHPKIIAHHHDALHPAPVALPQGLHQFGVLLLPSWHAAIARTGPARSALSCPTEFLALAATPPVCLSGSDCHPGGTTLSQAMQQTALGFLRRRLDVNGNHVLDSRGNNPALTSDDLPQPDGP